MITPRRKQELRQQYTLAVKDADQEETQHQWFLYLAALYWEDDDYQIFMEIRSKPRNNGLKLDTRFLAGEITRKQLFNRIQVQSADAYVLLLNQYGLAEIELADPAYIALRTDVTFKVLKALKDVDPGDKTEVCTAMAKTWHYFIRRLHVQYGLPTPAQMKKLGHIDSDAERAVLDSDDFETVLTPQELADFEAEVA